MQREGKRKSSQRTKTRIQEVYQICEGKDKIEDNSQPADYKGEEAEPVFVDLLRGPGIDSQPGGPVRNPICRTGPPGYIGWRNRFLGIDAWAP
jgi:hypothetical protein